MKFYRNLLICFFLFLPLFTFADNQALIAEMADKARASASDSLLIVQDGKVLYENYFGGTDRVRNVQSITKSISALAIAALMDDGKISSLDTLMSQWIPAWSQDAAKSQITLRMVMSQTSGYPDVDTIPDFLSLPDLVSSAIAVPLIAKPGSEFRYSSIACSLLQTVISQASGQSVEEFVNQRIFAALEITDSKWKRDAVGHERTSGGLFLSTADL
jgi:CubicO group peptidase (beta-lactamase class C family)